MTPTTILSAEALLKELQLIRKCGYSVDNEESEIGLTCFAAPVRDYTNSSVVAISISGPTARMQLHKDELITSLLETAAVISGELGYKGFNTV